MGPETAVDISIESVLLFRVIVVLAGIAGVAWLGLGLPMRIMPPASLRFAAANFLILVSILLAIRRDADINVLHYFVPQVTGVLAFTLMRAGIRRVVRVRDDPGEPALVLVLAIAALGVAQWREAPFGVHAALFSAAAAWIFIRAFHECAARLRHEFGRVALLGLWPLGLVGLLFLVRAIAVFFLESPTRQFTLLHDPDTQPVLWAFMILLLAINITLMGMALGRLVGRIRMLAERDALTGTMNRRVIESRIEAELARFRRNGRVFALAVIDLDHFKRINDTIGHKGGDAALVHATRVMQRTLRESDLLGRFGGEEFVAMLPESDLAGAAQVAERMRADLANGSFDWDGKPNRLTASIGVTLVATDDTAESLFRRADHALYIAKENGRDRVELAPA